MEAKSYGLGSIKELVTVLKIHVIVLFDRGRILGSSSAINSMSWTRPSKSDIGGDILLRQSIVLSWERLGNGGWNWDRFNKHVQRVTPYTPLNLPEEEHVRRGTPAEARRLWDRKLGNGPIQITHPPLRLDVDTKLEQTYRNLSIPMAPTPLNDIVTVPVTEDPMTLQRSFAANAYWAPNSSRPNFRILTGALAHHLVSESINGELVVTGVEFSHKSVEDKTYVVNASKEVVLSAGALKMPQILELSGVGRPDILEKLKVPVKIPLAGVGENMFGVGLPSVQLKDEVPDETLDISQILGEAARHMDLLYITMCLTLVDFTPLCTFSDKAEEIIAGARKNIEAGIAPENIVDQYKIVLEAFENKVPWCETIGLPGFLSFPNPSQPGKKYYTIAAALNQLSSRGPIHTTSSDPKAHPDLDPHYFEEETDIKMLGEVVKFCRKVAQTEPFKDYLAGEINPRPSVNTDDEIAGTPLNHILTSHPNFLKNFVGLTFRYTLGSASMLPKEKNGVVETKLKVYGTKPLRVVDLSIVPLHLRCHS
ncbi:GMC oxidoreductase [Macrolepiota fuliginosa MF-IS2]|uniref:pyranose dehydrogenase (acceptor) n=1 Tax=Macrolepiota fuliginosa MF-IS2 TaxID=1400762 RepID=A0A9P5XGP3_9AGAR|nr:GMC oxidoreductase [Macrolepiota fuliginosa MF-IS2]